MAYVVSYSADGHDPTGFCPGSVSNGYCEFEVPGTSASLSLNSNAKTPFNVDVTPTCGISWGISAPRLVIHHAGSSSSWVDLNTAAPEAADDSAVVTEDTPLTITVLNNDTDADGDALSVARVSQPEHGTAQVADDGAVTYLPALNYNGPDQFSYVVSDGAKTDEAEVSIDVTAMNDPPQVVGMVPDQAVEVGDEPMTLDLSPYFSDPDGDALEFEASASSPDVELLLAGSNLTLSAVRPGASTVTVTAADPDGMSAEQSFAVATQDYRPRAVVEDALAAMGRGQLASARATLGRRVTSSGQEESRVTVSGISVPLSAESAAETGRGMAEQWIMNMARPGMHNGESGMSETSNNEVGQSALSPSAYGGQSEFVLGFGGAGKDAASPGTRWTAWGQADVQMFQGGQEGEGYSGSLLTTYVGVDAKLTDRWLAGLAVARSRSEADWNFGGATGVLNTEVVSLQPYVRWSDSKTSLWAMFGGGGGDLVNERARYGLAEENGLGLRLGLMEARRRLGRTSGGVELALRGDASWAQLSTSEGSELAGGLDVAVHQLRVGIDVSSSVNLANTTFEPFGEVHVREDGGSGDTGTGLELSGGLRVNRGIFRVEGMGRILALHSADGYSERGASLTLSVGEGAQQPGLTLSLQPQWGAPAMGSQMLWQDQLYRREVGGNEQTGGFDTRVDYGLQVGRGLLSPFGLYGESQYGQRIQMGLAVNNLGPLRLEGSGERHVDPFRGSQFRMSVLGTISFGGADR